MKEKPVTSAYPLVIGQKSNKKKGIQVNVSTL